MRNFLIISLLMFLAACQGNPSDQSKSDNNANKKDEKDEIIINVESARSYSGDSIATYRSTAILEADRAASVTTKTSGIILDILVEEGDIVKKDDVLLILESDEQNLSLKSARANYEKSLNNYQRAQKLIAKGLTNIEQIDNLKFETEVLKSTLDQAKMNLSFTRIKAPFDGVVVKRMVKIGNLIQNATAVFEVIDFNSLQAKIDVPEHQWNIMKEGLEVQFQFDAIPNKMVIGEVIRVSPVIDSASGTFEVTVSINNEDMSLRPGLFAKANIVYDQKSDVVLVDKNAIIREDELAYVYVLEDESNINKTEVSLGYEMPDSFEIVTGLTIDQEVITTGKNNLTPDAKVNVVNYEDNL